MLDAEENLHLALHASAAGQPHACLTYLKEALSQEPRNAKGLYLLAIQHAQLGLLARAITGMQAALAIKPDLTIARFQLGLLLLDSRRVEEARQSFSMLRSSPDRGMRAYAEAMCALADDDKPLAQSLLEKGLAQGTDNAPLDTTMRNILDRLMKAGETPVTANATEGKVFLGAYRREAP